MWKFENCFGHFNPRNVYIVDVGFGYSIKYDGLRDSKKFTAIGENSERLKDTETLEAAIGECVWDKAKKDYHEKLVLENMVL